MPLLLQFILKHTEYTRNVFKHEVIVVVIVVIVVVIVVMCCHVVDDIELWTFDVKVNLRL